MTKLDWEKAKRRDLAPKKRRYPRRYPTKGPCRALVLNSFVKKHHLVCFVCDTDPGVWGKTGISARGPWAICLACAEQSKKRKTSNGD